jgi:hypothetical protein
MLYSVRVLPTAYGRLPLYLTAHNIRRGRLALLICWCIKKLF